MFILKLCFNGVLHKMCDVINRNGWVSRSNGVETISRLPVLYCLIFVGWITITCPPPFDLTRMHHIEHIMFFTLGSSHKVSGEGGIK